MVESNIGSAERNVKERKKREKRAGRTHERMEKRQIQSKKKDIQKGTVQLLRRWGSFFCARFRACLHFNREALIHSCIHTPAHEQQTDEKLKIKGRSSKPSRSVLAQRRVLSREIDPPEKLSRRRTSKHTYPCGRCVFVYWGRVES